MIEFLLNTLWSYENSLRRTGRTTHLIGEARRTGAVIVCHCGAFANRIMTDHCDVSAISLDKYLYDEIAYRGVRKKPVFIFDSVAEVEIVRMKLKEAQRIMEERPLG